MSRPRKIRVLIPDGDSPFALQVAQCLRRGDPTICVEAAYVDPKALARYSRFVKRCHRLDKDSIIESLCAVIEANDIDVLLPISGPGITFVALHADRLAPLVNLAPLPTVDQIDMVNDKWLFAERLRNAGISIPETRLVSSPKCVNELDPDDAVIMKPRTGSGGLGIVCFDSVPKLASKMDRFLGKDDPFILQHFVTGHDIDRSVLCVNGQVVASTVQEGVSKKKDLGPSGSLHFHRDSRVEKLVDCVVAELNWTGIAHFDLRYGDDGRLYVIEVNPRFWSTLMGSYSAGVNFPLIAVQVALGMEEPYPRMHECYYVSLKEWPRFQRDLKVPLSRSSLYHGMSDPIAKLLKKYRPSMAMGENKA